MAARFPAHLHMNLLPRAQGHGLGPRLLTLWLEMAGAAGVRSTHVGPNDGNTRAIRFWERMQFRVLDDVPSAPGRVWMGRPL